MMGGMTMGNKEAFSVPMPAKKEVLGEGPSFQDAICTMLQTVKAFEGFGQPELMYLAQHMRAYQVPAGGTIYYEGDRGGHFSVLIEGRISVYKEDSDDQVKCLNIMRPGSIFGEISVIDNRPTSASLVAESDVVIVDMPRETFQQCVNQNPAFGVRLVCLVARILSARLRSASGRLVDYIDVWG